MAPARSKRPARHALERQVCASIAERFGSAITLLNAAFADQIGLNGTDFKCLAILGQSGAITAGRLAELAAMSSAATTLVVDRLERAGLVSRERDPDDRRKVILRPNREAALSESLTGHQVALARAMTAIMASYSDRELATIGAFLDQASGVLEGVGERLRSGKR